jgi:hypothetical protein
MSEAVNIVIGVIEQMNLSSEDRLKLVDMLGQSVAVKPIQVKKMSKTDLYANECRRWLLENQMMFQSKK